MDIHKTKSVVNPHFSQADIDAFQPLRDAANAALKRILLARYESGQASLQETRRLAEEYRLGGVDV